MVSSECLKPNEFLLPFLSKLYFNLVSSECLKPKAYLLPLDANFNFSIVSAENECGKTSVLVKLQFNPFSLLVNHKNLASINNIYNFC